MTDPLVTPPAPTRTSSRRHWLLAGIIAILGGYLTIVSVGGSLIQQLAGFAGGPPELTLLFVAQLVFAVAVTVLGFFLAPGSLGARLLGSVVYIVAVALLVVLLTLRVSAGLGRALSGPFIGATVTNPFFMILLFGALGWLIASRAKPIAYLALVLAVVIAPVGFLLAMAGASGPVSSIVQLSLVAIAAVVVLLVSTMRPAAPAIPTADLAA